MYIDTAILFVTFYFFYKFSRNTPPYFSWRNIFCHHRPCSNYHIIPYSYRLYNHSIHANMYIIPYFHFSTCIPMSSMLRRMDKMSDNLYATSYCTIITNSYVWRKFRVKANTCVCMGVAPDTERQFQRASNHNDGRPHTYRSRLKDNFKEHQITTCMYDGGRRRRLKDNFKEHQITTQRSEPMWPLYWKTISKSIKSQPPAFPLPPINTERQFQRASNHNGPGSSVRVWLLKDNFKEHQITTPTLAHLGEQDWKTISKSIKSQPKLTLRRLAATERQFQRASNHNTPPEAGAEGELKDNFKEHQITTLDDQYTFLSNWKTISKSIKSQLRVGDAVSMRTERQFQRASNHNSISPMPWDAGTERQFQRASNHNLVLHLVKSWLTERQFQRASNHNFGIAEGGEKELKDNFKEHQITTEGMAMTPPPNWKTISKSIKSQRSTLASSGFGTERQFQRASNHNPFFQTLAGCLTERQFQRASNHNNTVCSSFALSLKDNFKEHQITTVSRLVPRVDVLKDNFKEHQITTARASCRPRRRLKDNFKEHQITTQGVRYVMVLELKDNFKEHQITTSDKCDATHGGLKDNFKEHQITTESLALDSLVYWKTISKSIKSQHVHSLIPPRITERQFQRASNHNAHARILHHERLKDNFKEHQITTRRWPFLTDSELKDNFKEHQITTSRARWQCPSNWKTISKSIKSQLSKYPAMYWLTERQFQRASNHN